MTDEYLETKEKNIYAIGDVTSSPWLAHKASHEGIIASEKIAGLKKVHKLNVDTIPGCTYSYPQIASIGLTEKQAINKGIKIKVGKFPFLGNGKAVAMGEEEGFVKTIFNGVSGELIGAQSKLSYPPDAYLLMPLSGISSPEGIYDQYQSLAEKYGKSCNARFRRVAADARCQCAGPWYLHAAGAIADG